MNKHSKLTGVKEIARRANVSLATVDRVIHNRSGVSKKTKEKIEAIIKELNYQPNILARRLASPKKLKLASLIPHVSAETNFWESPKQGILQAEAEIKQYGVEIEKYYYNLEKKESFIQQAETILKTDIDGILIAPLFIEESIHFTASLHEKNIPFIFIDSDIPNTNNLSYIGPDLFQSGYVVAHLISYMAKKEQSKILIVNIAKEIENNHPLLRIEDGFISYLKEKEKKFKVIQTEIKETDYKSVKSSLLSILKKEKTIDAIFVTSSRVFSVAKFIEEEKIGEKAILIGFDFLSENVKYLKKEIIDFLICHKPKEQAYKGINTLFHHLVSGQNTNKYNFMPIEIISKGNAQFYTD